MNKDNTEVLKQNENVKSSGQRVKDMARNKTILGIGIVLLVVASFVAGVNAADSKSLESIGIKVVDKEPPKDLTTIDYGLLWDALRVVNTKYVDKPVEQKNLMYGAVDGLVRALDDPYSTFLDPEENERFLNDLKGNFEGIGAEISIKNEVLTVVAPLPDTPASKAGLRPQDSILKIDGEDTYNMSLEEAVTKIRGEKGTTVVLTVLHKGANDTEDVSIVRDEIHVDSVSSEIRNVNNQKIGIIELSRFGPDTNSNFEHAARGLLNQGADSLVLDLRSNPGGLLDAAIDIASFWLNNNTVVLKEVDAEKQEFKYFSKGKSLDLSGIPTVVLINEGSASASEIVTGALQDHGLATVVGQTSFGKGSVQDLVRVGDGAAVKITIAKWLTPNGLSIDQQGIEPGEKVERTLEDWENDRDPQMDRALEMLANN